MKLGPYLLDVPKDAQKLRLDRELFSNDRPVLYFGPDEKKSEMEIDGVRI